MHRDSLVQVTYSARPFQGGFLPKIVVRVGGGAPTVEQPWGRPLDEDDALLAAKELAEDRAARYVGGWDVVVMEEGARANPRRPSSPPPPSHLFQLTADPYQQRLFGPDAFEQRPKKRAVEPAPVDERQVDLFAPPPPKKNPDPGVKWQKYGPKGVDWEGEWLVTVDGRKFRAWRDPEIDSFWFVPASDTTTSLHGAVFDQKSPAVHAGFSREECVRAMRKFSR
jgi:hypothetical protein